MSWARMLGLALSGLVMTVGVAFTAPMRVEHQIDILAQTDRGEDGWFVEPSEDTNWDKWHYAVTDLNHSS